MIISNMKWGKRCVLRTGLLSLSSAAKTSIMPVYSALVLSCCGVQVQVQPSLPSFGQGVLMMGTSHAGWVSGSRPLSNKNKWSSFGHPMSPFCQPVARSCF